MMELQIFNNMEIKILEQKEILGKNITVYGTNDNPLFLAKDIAQWLGLTNVTDMISRGDQDEVTKLNLGSFQGWCNFLTENGFYKVLMQSRKPIAKTLKRGIKQVLKQHYRDTQSNGMDKKRIRFPSGIFQKKANQLFSN